MAASSCVSMAEKIIKPHSPTPSSLKRYNLCLTDEIMVPVYMPIVALYPFSSKTPQQVSNILENSLSKLLSSYYPFAGTLGPDNATFVDCNDRGAKFIQVRYDCTMSEIVNLPDTGPEYLPFAKGTPWSSTPDEQSLLLVQLSHFNCGGLAISVRLSHKIADGCTLANFISDWASIARDDNANIPSPQLIGSSIFPPFTETPSTGIHTDTNVDYEFYNLPVSKKRYLFSNSKLEMLKTQVESETGVQNPTRIEVLSALIYKCAVTAARANSSSYKPSSLSLPVNLRPILNPPLETRTIGNIISFIKVDTMSEDEMTIGRVVREIRKGKDELKQEGDVKKEKLVSLWNEWIHSIELYRSSSVCNYPLNNLDFGWGKPNRVTIPVFGVANTCMFMDNLSGDGIEVIIVLPEKDVTQFENSKELLQFASPVTNL
ncbi:hypothetical protein EJD97_020655 [Solanum chilense]|uniref:Acylsugar acyltransferase 3 n=1 Tax=Solanum chilense TaxID=4083 RepID=A0A6N2AZ59_SOLCI|nr:hypothetical protein EJD97_020655 [Solanum chilense]